MSDTESEAQKLTAIKDGLNARARNSVIKTARYSPSYTEDDFSHFVDDETGLHLAALAISDDGDRISSVMIIVVDFGSSDLKAKLKKIQNGYAFSSIIVELDEDNPRDNGQAYINGSFMETGDEHFMVNYPSTGSCVSPDYTLALLKHIPTE